MTLARPTLALLALSLAACDGGPTCGAGTRYDEATDSCVPVSADGGPVDAGDSGSADAGPCGMPCTGPTPVCDASSGACVACLGDGDCAGDTPLCDTTAQECVTCLGDADCSDPSAARCDAGTCVPCDDNAQCVGIAGLGVCDVGACVQCTAADRTACGTNVCDGATNTCTTRPANSADLCQGCVADAECQTGQLCVPMTFMATDVGSFCLWREDASMPPGPGARASTCDRTRGRETPRAWTAR